MYCGLPARAFALQIVAEIISGRDTRVRPPSYQGLRVKPHSVEIVNLSQRAGKASGQSSLYWESPNLGRLLFGFGALTTVTGA
jgi:hypothetical protein